MSISLLDKTRKLSRLLHNNTNSKVAFDDICQVLGENLSSDVMVLSRRGKLLGVYEFEGVRRLGELLAYEDGVHIDGDLNERFLSILSTQDNVNLMTLGFRTDAADGGGRYHAIASPIYAGGERLGTLFIFKDKGWYDMDDIILAEYAGTVVGMELLRSHNEEAGESDRQEQVVKGALEALSASEKEAVRYILGKIEGDEALFVTGRVAEEMHIARSVVINAIRKLESAGIIKSRSAGVKGTYIHLLNGYILTCNF
ncbi:MAG: GTP-sensing pleiotropic transcriptional regulator CodY [Lachnospiraceae bacterium]|nr:GTP-sensing pleiotropic transcriptional regulator CodY [Lachnospiraceae bacterium]